MNVRNIFRAKTEKRTLGDIGERAAARYLRRHGYKIKKRGF
jgi:Holliday junction resolvase-like predicted endonuclease